MVFCLLELCCIVLPYPQTLNSSDSRATLSMGVSATRIRQPLRARVLTVHSKCFARVPRNSNILVGSGCRDVNFAEVCKGTPQGGR